MIAEKYVSSQIIEYKNIEWEFFWMVRGEWVNVGSISDWEIDTFLARIQEHSQTQT